MVVTPMQSPLSLGSLLSLNECTLFSPALPRYGLDRLIPTIMAWGCCRISVTAPDKKHCHPDLADASFVIEVADT